MAITDTAASTLEQSTDNVSPAPAKHIEQLKVPTLNNAGQTARADLDKLWRANKKALRALIAEYNEQLNNESGSD